MLYEVITESLDDTKDIVAAIRLQSYANGTLYSFAETMGVPEEALSYAYYFPSYNNIWGPLNSQVRFANLDASATTVRVTIVITSYSIHYTKLYDFWKPMEERQIIYQMAL